VSTADDDFIPLFLVQPTEAIESIDNQITHYTSVDAFATVVEGKGLTKTVGFIRQALAEAEQGQFYVYSIRTDSADGFSNSLKSCAGRTEIRDAIYIEENKGATSNTIANKIGAIKNGLSDNYTNGCPRTALIIPLGTVSDAVANKESGTNEATVINQLTTITNGISTGRILVSVPDESIIGGVVGKFIGRADNEEIGYAPFTTNIPALTYNFNDAEILQLLNLGCLVVAPHYNRGNIEYKIEAGVTTSFKSSQADGLLLSRSIADALLRSVKLECDEYLKQKLTTNTITLLQADIDGVVADYVARDDVVEAGTKLTVTQSSVPYTVNVSGTIQTVGGILIINVDTTLTV
jgi:hypothetical protein